jgi:hypothetical protein
VPPCRSSRLYGGPTTRRTVPATPSPSSCQDSSIEIQYSDATKPRSDHKEVEQSVLLESWRSSHDPAAVEQLRSAEEKRQPALVGAESSNNDFLVRSEEFEPPTF